MNSKKRKKPRHVHIVAKIDNKPPHFDASINLKAHDLQQDALRVKQIDKENMKLLKKINIIHRLGGPVDCWAPDVRYKSKFEDQERKNNIIMRKNRIMLKKIRQAESQYPTRAFLKNWKNMHEALEHRARYISVIQRLSVVFDAQKQLSEKSRTRCFFDIGLKEESQKLGRIVFELYDSVVPRTCENFAAFCRGVNGLSYKHTPFHRIVSGYWCQGGDVTKFDGTGGTSIYGDSFDKENSNLRHIGPGILSTCDNNDGKNDSKFNLTFKCLKTVDPHKTVFGRVIDGMINIYKIEGFGTKTGKPIKSVIVLNCGVLSAKRTYERLSKFQI
ncbi:peptidyl-prolyl cis-trans isomerase 3 [Temnothorax longispinosus]|uniref:E3 SUMO-protein ligase RanBP2 n=1 Tax=Temnothorax longispinosus TaxID=300112 RepID=A0A4S2KSQ1_9HYME|nr:E3 SUMO-protein ligase RanBP2 [Temnothorax longispinosus]